MHRQSTQHDEFCRRAEAWVNQIEAELHDVVGYVDRVVVPEVRREAISVARLLAGHLERLADRVEAAGGRPCE